MPNRPTLHYVEAFDHIELLYRWLPVLAELDVPVICHLKTEHREDFVARFAERFPVRFTGPTRQQAWANYLTALRLDSHDVVFIATIGRRPGWFTRLAERSRCFIVLHNLNYCFGRWRALQPVRSIQTGVRRMKDLIYRPSLNRLLAAAAGFVYPCRTLQENALRAPKYRSKLHLVIPFAFPNANRSIEPSSGNGPTIVVPGAFSTKNKDTDLLQSVLAHISHHEIPINVHFAGPVMDPARLGALRASVGDAYLYTYPTGIHPVALSELLTTASLVWAPLRRTATLGAYREELGITKISGALFDAVHANKLLLLPDWYPVDHAEGCLRYADKDDAGERIVAAVQDSADATADWSSYHKARLVSGFNGLFAATP